MRSKSLLLLGLAMLLAACGKEGGTSTSDAGANDASHVIDAAPGSVTWYREVLPIVQAKCQGCHRDGALGPFPLMTYQDAQIRHALLAHAVETGAMPPWLPSGDCRSFRDSRALAQAEIDTFVAWSHDGAPAGDPADAPVPPTPAPPLDWVDKSVDTGFDYASPDGESDHYQCFVVDPGLGAGADLIGFQITPGDSRVVHHVLVFPTDLAEAKALDAADPAPGYTCFGGPGTRTGGIVGGWVPGMPPTHFPDQTGLPLAAGSGLIIQIHYNTTHTNGKGVPDRTRLDLQYARSTVTRATILSLADNNFAVPPDAKGYSHSTSISAPSAGFIRGIAAHMHTRGVTFTVENKSQGACVLNIPRWDFSWQQMYFYDVPIAVKKGDEIKLTCTWDNPTAQTLTWGEKTTDEMCLVYFYATAQ